MRGLAKAVVCHYFYYSTTVATSTVESSTGYLGCSD